MADRTEPDAPDDVDLIIAAQSVCGVASEWLAATHPTPPGRGEKWPRESQLILTLSNMLNAVADRLVDYTIGVDRD